MLYWLHAVLDGMQWPPILTFYDIITYSPLDLQHKNKLSNWRFEMNVVDLLFGSHIEEADKYPSDDEINQPSITVTLQSLRYKSSDPTFPYFEDVLGVIQDQWESAQSKSSNNGKGEVGKIYVSQ